MSNRNAVKEGTDRGLSAAMPERAAETPNCIWRQNDEGMNEKRDL
jgi:hypothetical protein